MKEKERKTVVLRRSSPHYDGLHDIPLACAAKRALVNVIGVTHLGSLWHLQNTSQRSMGCEHVSKIGQQLMKRAKTNFWSVQKKKLKSDACSRSGYTAQEKTVFLQIVWRKIVIHSKFKMCTYIPEHVQDLADAFQQTFARSQRHGVKCMAGIRVGSVSLPRTVLQDDRLKHTHIAVLLSLANAFVLDGVLASQGMLINNLMTTAETAQILLKPFSEPTA